MSRLPQSTRRYSAFTLVEILVVICIIALLAAILFPVFQRSRESSRRSSCQSNLRQIGLGFEQYKNDFDNWYPGSVNIFAPSAAVVAWPTKIFPYVRNEQVFVCPSADVSNFDPDPEYFTTAQGMKYCGITNTEAAAAGGLPHAGDGSPAPQSLVNRLSYARNLIDDTDTTSISNNPSGWYRSSTTIPRYKPCMNAGCTVFGTRTGYIDKTNVTGSINETAVEDPVGTIHIVDAMSGSETVDPCRYGTSMGFIRGDRSVDYIRSDWSPVPRRDTYQHLSYRHFGGFNALFGDGHVKWRRWGTTRREEWSIQDG